MAVQQSSLIYADVNRPTIGIYQTNQTNAYLRSINGSIPAAWGPVLDIMLSVIVNRNMLPREERKVVKARRIPARVAWSCSQIAMDIAAVFHIIYPKGSIVKPARALRGYTATFTNTLDEMSSDSGFGLLESYDLLDDTQVCFHFNRDAISELSAVEIPSPLAVPVELYRFNRGLNWGLVSPYSFISNRMLLADRKMNIRRRMAAEANDGYTTFDLPYFTTMTGLPTYGTWSQHPDRRLDGPVVWAERLVKRSVESYGLFQVDVSRLDEHKVGWRFVG